MVLFWRRFIWHVYLFLSGSLILVGGLFLLNWLFRKELRAGRDAGTNIDCFFLSRSVLWSLAMSLRHIATNNGFLSLNPV